MAQTHLTASGISQTFGRRTVLKNASFTAGAGECIGIVGINGGGKSTLLSILAGTRKPSGGTLEICGHPMFQERRLFSELTAYLPQDNPLLEDLTVRDNLRLWFGRKVPEDMPILRRMQLTELRPRRV